MQILIYIDTYSGTMVTYTHAHTHLYLEGLILQVTEIEN